MKNYLVILSISIISLAGQLVLANDPSAIPSKKLSKSAYANQFYFDQIGRLLAKKAPNVQYSMNLSSDFRVLTAKILCPKGTAGCSKDSDDILSLRLTNIQGAKVGTDPHSILEVLPETVIAGYSVADNMKRCKELAAAKKIGKACFDLKVNYPQTGFEFEYTNLATDDNGEDTYWTRIHFFDPLGELSIYSRWDQKDDIIQGMAIH